MKKIFLLLFVLISVFSMLTSCIQKPDFSRDSDSSQSSTANNDASQSSITENEQQKKPTTETTDGETDVTDKPVTPTVHKRQLLSSVKNIAFSNIYTAWSANNPVSFKQNVTDMLEETTVKRIGVPIKKISDPTKDCKTAVHLVTETVPATVINTYPLIIPANTYTQTVVNEWVYFDVDIKIEKGQHLAFGTTDETVFWGYADVNVAGASEAIQESRGCRINIDSASPGVLDHSLLFDIYYEKKEEQNMNSLKGKYISILGASTSTFKGFNNCSLYNTTIVNNATYYSEGNLSSANDTWWMKTINKLDMKLCVNNSWSGSCVSTRVDSDQKAACMDRATQLHNDRLGIDPDIIVLIIGGNDALQSYPIGSYNGVDDIYDKNTQKYIGDCTLFGQAYATLVHKVKARYTNADIYVCSMLRWRDNGMTQYNDIIMKIADEFDVTYVDFYNGTNISPSTKETYLFSDGVHPNAAGFEQMSNCIVNILKSRYTEE